MATLLAATLCVALVGCGSSVDPNASALEREVEVTEAPEVVEPPADAAEATDEGWAEESPEEAWEDEPTTEETYVEEVTPEAELSGLMVVQADWSNTRVLSYTIYAVNPETGASQEVGQFQFTDVKQNNDAEYAIQPALNFGRYANLYGYFSSDYTKIAATKFFAGNGEKHAGWLDANGNFFDVTEALGEQAQTDFDELASYYAVGFQEDLFIYVRSDNTRENQYYGVSIENIAPGASWEIDAADSIVGADYANWSWLNKNYRPTCWLDDDRILVETLQNHGKEGKCRIATVSSQTFEEYLPGEDTNSNWSAVASPDGDRVAFISRRVSGEDVNFYVASIAGENPVKLEPDFNPVFSPSTEILLTYGGACCYILEWR